jgi:hypothetical protein
VAHHVVNALLENQKDLPARIRTEPKVLLGKEGIKMKVDVAPGEDFAGEASHACRQIAEPISLRIDRPDDVAHGIDRLA